jgi:dipeptide/tripeptide permease
MTPVVSGYMASRFSVASGFGLNSLLIALGLVVAFVTIRDKE